jgi:hypothetical protein
LSLTAAALVPVVVAELEAVSKSAGKLNRRFMRKSLQPRPGAFYPDSSEL